jgi:hypothetical protein
MEAIEEGAHGTDLWKGVAQAPAQAGIVLEEAEVLGAITAGGEEEEEGLDELGLGETAGALFEGEVGLDDLGELEGAEGS